ncbi:hypothetical protein MJD09_16665, partial [bacterium]|nr:hypothetical protein [bacterium]
MKTTETNGSNHVFPVLKPKMRLLPYLCLLPVLSIFLLLSAVVQAQPRSEVGQPLITNFTPKDYGAMPQNFDIAQDHRGVMYFANRGVLEYDGASWRLIPMPNNTYVASLALDANGRIYVGTRNDFGYLAPDASGTMTYLSLLNHVPEEDRNFGMVPAVHVTPNSIYFGGGTHLFRYLPGGSMADFRVWKTDSRFQGSFFVHETLYVCIAGLGLTSLQEDSLVLVPDGELFSDKAISFILSFADQDRGATNQKLFVATPGNLFTYDGMTFWPFKTEASGFLRASQIRGGTLLSSGEIALATRRGGVAIVDRQGRFLRHVDRAAGLLDDFVSAVYEDRGGTIWLGLDSGIARAETGSPFTFYREDQSGRTLAIYPAIHRHQGRLYVATSLGLSYLDSQTLKFRPVSGIDGRVFDLLSFEETLLSASGRGVHQITRDRTSFVKRSVNRSYQALDLLRSKKNRNRSFVGLRDGLASLLWRNGRWIDEGRIPGIQASVLEFDQSSDGTLWVGSRAKGVWQVEFPVGADR